MYMRQGFRYLSLHRALSGNCRQQHQTVCISKSWKFTNIWYGSVSVVTPRNVH